MPDINSEDLEGSMLGEAIKPYLNGDIEIYVAPELGMHYVEAWKL